MADNLINDIVSEIKVYSEQLKLGQELTNQQLSEASNNCNMINELATYLTSSNTFDESALKSAAFSIAQLSNDLNSINRSSVSEKDAKFIMEANANLSNLSHTISATLQHNQNQNSIPPQAGPNASIGPKTEMPALDAGISFGKFTAGTTVGAVGGAGALSLKATELAVKGAEELTKEIFRASGTAGLNIYQGSALLWEDIRNSANQFAENLRKPRSTSEMSSLVAVQQPKNEGGLEVIEMPSQSFGSFHEKQTETKFLTDVANTAGSIALLDDLSQNDSLNGGGLSNKVMEDLKENVGKLNNSSQDLSGFSKDKFKGLAERIKQGLEVVEVDKSINERLREAVKEIFEKLKEILNNLFGRGNNQNFGLSTS